MKILLAAVNAKYIHSNPAVYSLRAAAGKYRDCVVIKEFTINQTEDFILSSIYKEKPDVAAFSCYIWNIESILSVAQELRKVLPEIKLWLGGPEVSYDVENGPLSRDFIEGIMIGEGEGTFYELLTYYIEGTGKLEETAGIAYRDALGQIRINPGRAPLPMDALPFPYSDLTVFENRILYYETSRGCPFRCSYCLSSLDKSVRFRSFSLVRKELAFFLANRVPQVKFVDRTFNCNAEHAMEIWRFIRDSDNGITNFHFEIAADLLTQEQLALLSELRPGLVQLEIGVQSVNRETLSAIRRKTDFQKIRAVMERLGEGRNIHRHLDLIAGLPCEDFASFRRSFNEVYGLRPEQLQLGFLKVLKGTAIRMERLKYHTRPPYEVLETPWLSYGELLRLKQVEEMTEIYYNSGQFTKSIRYLEHFFETPFDLYESLGRFYEEEGLAGVNHARIRRYEILLSFFARICAKGEDTEEKALRELLVYDLYLRENLKSRPSFAPYEGEQKEKAFRFFRREEQIRTLLPGCRAYSLKQIAGMTHLEFFTIDINKTAETGLAVPGAGFALFDYRSREPFYGQALVITGEDTGKADYHGEKNNKSGKGAD